MQRNLELLNQLKIHLQIALFCNKLSQYEILTLSWSSFTRDLVGFTDRHIKHASPLLLPCPYWCVFVCYIGYHAPFQSAARMFYFHNLLCHARHDQLARGTLRLSRVTGVTSNSLTSPYTWHLYLSSLYVTYQIRNYFLPVFLILMEEAVVLNMSFISYWSMWPLLSTVSVKCVIYLGI
jgi:hypothetical protein